MNEIIVNNLISVSKAMLIFVMSWGSNFAFGTYYNIALEGNKWDKNKFFKSVIKMFVFVVGLALITTVASILPVFADETGFAIPEEYKNVITTLAIITAVFTVSLKYLTEAFATFYKILNYEPREAVNVVYEEYPLDTIGFKVNDNEEEEGIE